MDEKPVSLLLPLKGAFVAAAPNTTTSYMKYVPFHFALQEAFKILNQDLPHFIDRGSASLGAFWHTSRMRNTEWSKQNQSKRKQIYLRRTMTRRRQASSQLSAKPEELISYRLVDSKFVEGENEEQFNFIKVHFHGFWISKSPLLKRRNGRGSRILVERAF